MTVSTTNNKKVYAGLATQDTFSYDFRVDAKADMNVYFDDVLQDSGDWSITNLGNPAGGDVVLTVPLAADTTIVLLREVALTQDVDYQPLDPFPAEVNEQALDKLTFLAQQLQEQINRSVVLPVSDESGTAFVLGDPTDNDTRIPYYDASINGLEASDDMTYDADAVTGPQLHLQANPAATTGPILQLTNGIAGAANPAIKIIQSSKGAANGHGAINVDGYDVDAQIVVKQATEARTSTTTMSADSELSFYAEAQSIYEISMLLLFYCGSVTPNLKLDLSSLTSMQFVFQGAVQPAGSGGSGQNLAWSNSYGDNYNFDSGVRVGTNGYQFVVLDSTTTTFQIALRGFVKTYATAGVVSLEWAQNVSNATAVTMQKGSCIKAHRMGIFP